MAELMTRAQPLLGTIVEITAPSDCTRIVDGAFGVIRDIHRLMSFHEANSDVSRINRSETGFSIECDKHTIEVISIARSLYEDSDRHFDICTASELVRYGYLPDSGFHRAGVADGSPEDIVIESKRHIRLGKRLTIDLGGIAKGYAVDCAVRYLVALGAPAALVNAGGDLRLFGDEPWPIQLQQADGKPGEPIPLANCAVASSSNLRSRKRRLFRPVSPHIGRDRKPLIIDEAVAVVANRCVIADAMTKVAMADLSLANHLLAAHEGHVLQPAAPSLEATA